MKCLLCQMDNKDGAKACRKCGGNMELEPMWRPTWKWHAKVLICIYVALGGVYVALNYFLSRVEPPYRLRQIPPEITPWLKK